jgi:hypothetical protein
MGFVFVAVVCTALHLWLQSFAVESFLGCQPPIIFVVHFVSTIFFYQYNIDISACDLSIGQIGVLRPSTLVSMTP